MPGSYTPVPPASPRGQAAAVYSRHFMSPQAGSRLGPYELVSPIGAGGMGEVWRGRDTRLDRSVAVKILPDTFARDEQFRVRFEREARTISSLNHPHICTLFDVGHEGDSHFLVMELLEGESLADRLQKGPLPLDQVVRFGAQVAEALEGAHKQGIVHRDLKPGNVMLTKTGAKLLDFGLARTGAGVGGSSGSTELPTEARPLTTAGTVLGTFQYMAPEQLEGAEADARTDIFALGALLYEMATGRRAFEGRSRTSLIAAILSTQPPPISSVQPVMPPALDHVVRKCLEKDPEDRWQSAHDVASELRWIAEAGSQAGVPATVTLRRRSRERLAWILAAVFAVVAAAGLLWSWKLRRALDQAEEPLRVDLAPPPDVEPADVALGSIALAPDGRRLAFVAYHDQSTDIAVRDLASGETKRLPGTNDGSFPFWSPDGRWLAFFAEGHLKKAQASGGPVQVLCDAHAGRGGTWSPADTIVFAPDITGPLFRVPAAGGTPTPVTRTDDPNATHRNPFFLPDGRHFLFTVRGYTEVQGRVAVAAVDGGEPKELLARGSNPQYADTYLFSVVGGNLTAQPFDPERQTLKGQPIPIADAIEYDNAKDLAHFSVSSAATLVYRQLHLRKTQLVWLDRTGKELSRVGEPAYYLNVSSPGPGGQSLTAVRSNASGTDSDVWILDLQRSRATRSTFLSAAAEIVAAVSPDGSRLAVSAATGGGAGGASLWLQPASGSGSPEVLQKEGTFSVLQWSADGAYLIGIAQEQESGYDVAYVKPDDPSKTVHLTTSRFDERGPALSADGRYIAYVSDETGRREIFLSDFPKGQRKWQVSRSGGFALRWRGDGRELYFLHPPDEAMAVAVTERGDVPELGEPERLPFSARAFQLEGGVFSPDGRRFLVLRYDGEAVAEPIRLIRSWRRVVEK
jgi:Tol biopolymer transport system component